MQALGNADEYISGYSMGEASSEEDKRTLLVQQLVMTLPSKCYRNCFSACEDTDCGANEQNGNDLVWVFDPSTGRTIQEPLSMSDLVSDEVNICPTIVLVK